MAVSIGGLIATVAYLLFFPLLLSWLSQLLIEVGSGIFARFFNINARRLIASLFFPGIILHELAHTFTAKMFKLQLSTYAIFTFTGRDAWGGVVRDLRKVHQAFIIGYAPIIYIFLWDALFLFENILRLFLIEIDAGWLILVYWWILISLLFFGFPTPQDLIAPWITFTTIYPKTFVVILLALVGSLVAIPFWGWVPSVINCGLFFLFLLLYGTDEMEEVKQRNFSYTRNRDNYESSSEDARPVIASADPSGKEFDVF